MKQQREKQTKKQTDMFRVALSKQIAIFRGYEVISDVNIVMIPY